MLLVLYDLPFWILSKELHYGDNQNKAKVDFMFMWTIRLDNLWFKFKVWRKIQISKRYSMVIGSNLFTLI